MAMCIPTIHGYIERRILINYTADPIVIGRILPLPFRPKTVNGRAVVGICLIRLKNIKPKGFPDLLGVSSENGAHRIAVEWDADGRTMEGVFIPRRDTSLRLNSLVGGRLFPGRHHLAKFIVMEAAGHYHIDLTSSDGMHLSIDAEETTEYPRHSVFGSLDEASRFFEQGGIGYSPHGDSFHGLELHTVEWKVKPLAVSQVRSSYFEDEGLFPRGSIEFDNALLMTQVEHEWRALGTMKAVPINFASPPFA